jgi:hypothetical protein
MSRLRGRTHGHSQDKAFTRAKNLDGNIEDFDKTLDSPIAHLDRQVTKLEAMQFEKEQENKRIAEAKLREPKVLMKDGKWLVPPEERPKGWERINLAPPKENAPNSSDSICTPFLDESQESFEASEALHRERMKDEHS